MLLGSEIAAPVDLLVIKNSAAKMVDINGYYFVSIMNSLGERVSVQGIEVLK